VKKTIKKFRNSIADILLGDVRTHSLLKGYDWRQTGTLRECFRIPIGNLPINVCLSAEPSPVITRSAFFTIRIDNLLVRLYVTCIAIETNEVIDIRFRPTYAFQL